MPLRWKSSARWIVNQWVQPDVILLGRGGGSLEDLWAFNDERVVRAVVRSQAPVISGVGHETDFTLTDFAADLRAPTPTGSAVAAVPDMAELSDLIQGARKEVNNQIRVYLDDLKSSLQGSRMQLSFASPSGRIRQRMQTLDQSALGLKHMQERYFSEKKQMLEIASEKLASYDPYNVLKRGYAILTDNKGNPLSSTEQVQLDDEIQARVLDGVIWSVVSGKQPIEEKNNGKEK